MPTGKLVITASGDLAAATLNGQVRGPAGSLVNGALAVAQATVSKIPSVSVRETTAGSALFPQSLGQFDEGAGRSSCCSCS
jgi:hypothetical protein